MSKLRLALFALVIGLMWFLPYLPFAPSAQAVGNPYLKQECILPIKNATPGVGVASSCFLNNVSSGDTLILTVMVFATTSANATISATESFTCPAGTNVSMSAGALYKRCYVASASSHSTFTVTVTPTGSGGGGPTLQAFSVKVYTGLGAIDSGATGAARNDAASPSTTTAANNELVDADCVAFAGDAAAGTGFTMQYNGWAVDAGVSQDWRVLEESQVVASASTITSSCTYTNLIAGGNSGAIGILAFAISGATQPSPTVLQSSVFTFASANTSPPVELHNTQSGNWAVVGFITTGATVAPNVGFTCTESCTCPGAAQVTVTYSARQYTSGVCYVQLTTTHATFTASETDAGNNVVTEVLNEVSGLTSVDSSSAAAASAVTVNYTTAAANEWTFAIAGDVLGAAMVPGNSFGARMDTAVAENGPVIVILQGITMDKTTTASGSNTASYAQTGTTVPIISTLSFGPTPTPSNGYPVVIKYKPGQRHFYRIPWDRPRKVIELERI